MIVEAPPTLWHATTAAAPVRPAAAGEMEADLAIVGGGFAGLSSALHAAEAGLSVILLEGATLAWGASGRNAGFVVPNFAKVDPEDVVARLGDERGRRLVGFAAGSADLVFGLIRRHGIACDALQSGWIQPAPTAAALSRTHERARQWAGLGRPAEPLGKAEVTALTGAQGYLGGWIDRSGGVLNPVAYARGLADAAEAAGARVHENSAVISISGDGHGWKLGTGGAIVRARRVVLATNAYGAAIASAAARSFFPLRVFQIATEPLPASVRERVLPGGQCVSDTRRNLFTFRFDAQNRLISGGMHVLSAGAETRVPREIHARLARLLDLPDLPPIAFAWSGQAAVMPDFLPCVIELGSGLIAPFACNGRGIAMTTALGPELAAWAAGRPLGELALPSAAPQPIPLHGLMRHAPNALLPWSRLRDRWDERSSAEN
ncbi:FAD-dependent oxidoreductase [Paracoccus sp. S-4012]|uniref:NAD(P)/FAD-dependent oxidoreductase n=1 Tax=Paracoccus sp. S-4012 TaxID=2665648 RepID=UPI0012AFA103|nr:FAD-binding oxidoreductase [Paracoccus sp. S-4012]MRX51470.1 FAD-dependent oxidoreductase [Paracoccus sp. S-4012]